MRFVPAADRARQREKEKKISTRPGHVHPTSPDHEAARDESRGHTTERSTTERRAAFHRAHFRGSGRKGAPPRPASARRNASHRPLLLQNPLQALPCQTCMDSYFSRNQALLSGIGRSATRRRTARAVASHTDTQTQRATVHSQKRACRYGALGTWAVRHSLVVGSRCRARAEQTTRVLALKRLSYKPLPGSPTSLFWDAWRRRMGAWRRVAERAVVIVPEPICRVVSHSREWIARLASLARA